MRGLLAIEKPGAAEARTQRRSLQGRSAAEDGEHGFLNFEPYAYGRFKEDERQARERGAGMWKGCFVAPRDFRRWNKHSAPLLGPGCPADARRKLFPDDALMPAGCEIKGKYALRARLTGHRGLYSTLKSSCGPAT